MMESLKETSECTPDIQGDHCYGAQDNSQIYPGLLAGERIPEPSGQKQVIDVKINSEQDHEHGHDSLEIVAVVKGDTAVLDAETSGSCRAETGCQRIEKRHASQEKKTDLNQGHDQIDHIQDLGSVFYLGRQFAHGRSRAFGPHNVHGISAAGQRQDSQDKDQNPHASYPVGKAPPHEHGGRKSLDIGEDAGSGRGKSGYGLKQGVCQRRDLPADIKGKSAEKTEDHPD